MDKEDKEIRETLKRKYPTPQFKNRNWQDVVMKRISDKTDHKRHIGWWTAAAAAIVAMVVIMLWPKNGTSVEQELAAADTTKSLPKAIVPQTLSHGSDTTKRAVPKERIQKYHRFHPTERTIRNYMADAAPTTPQNREMSMMDEYSSSDKKMYGGKGSFQPITKETDFLQEMVYIIERQSGQLDKVVKMKKPDGIGNEIITYANNDEQIDNDDE